MKRGLQKEPPFCVVNILESRPTRPAQGPSAEGPGSPDGLRCASRGDQSPHVPPCPPGELGGKARFFHWGRRPVKFRSSLFKGLQGSRGGSAPRPPSAEGGTPFRREPFLCFFLFAIEKERRKPFALHRGRHPGRGAAGLLVTNGGQPFGAEKPAGPVPGCARTTHQKHPGGMFLRPPSPTQ